MNSLVVLILTLWGVRELYFLYSTHKLLNKLMSRNYFEYQTASGLGASKESPATNRSEDMEEDFGSLNGIG